MRQLCPFSHGKLLTYKAQYDLSPIIIAHTKFKTDRLSRALVSGPGSRCDAGLPNWCVASCSGRRSRDVWGKIEAALNESIPTGLWERRHKLMNIHSLREQLEVHD